MTPAEPPPIRFAYIAGRDSLQGWRKRCVEHLLRLGNVHVIARLPPNAESQSCVTPDARTQDELASLPVLTLDSDESLARVAALDLDFILCWEDERVPDGLLQAARFGVWRQQSGDWVRYRGEPGGFWEVYDGEPVSCAMLVRLQADLDEVIVLREATVRTSQVSWRRNRRQLQEFVFWAAQVCTDLRNGNRQVLISAPRRASRPPRGLPTPGQRLVCRVRTLLRLAASALRDLFRHEQWNVGVVDQPIAAFLDASTRAPTKWLPVPGDSEIRADPFGIQRDGRTTILCEYLNYDNNRGVIVAADPAGRTADLPVEIGPKPNVHLSYPFLLQDGDRLLCVPETHEAREIALYESERFPDRWRRVATLVSDTRTVDATLFRHESCWWLMGSEPAPKGANCQLHLWYSQDLSGPYRPHAGNPVKIDVRSARPGGTPFVHEGVLYRPAQDCSTRYGERIVINRVTELTPTSFREDFACAVEPDARGPYPAGLHTLSAVGNLTLIDGRRIRFVPQQLSRTLRFWARRLLRGLGSGHD